jgi:hypothetical protein
VLCGALLVCAFEPSARAQDSQECAEAYVGAQRLRNKAQLRAAREQLLVCSKDACAASLRTDCVSWLVEVDAQMPTVVFAAHGPHGRDVSAVRVLCDEVPLVEHLSGVAVPVDPGLHTFRFETAGAPPVEQSIMIREGQKTRVIDVSFPGEEAPNPPSPGAGGVPVWVDATVAGAGVLLTAAGITLYALSASAASKDALCHCNDQRSLGMTQRVLGDAFFWPGLVAMAAGAYLYLFHRPAASTGAAAFEPWIVRF